MNLPEVTNPFRNARVVAHNSSYTPQIVARGHPDFIMSRTELCQFAVCASRWKNGYKDDATDATEFGSLLDCLILQPAEFDVRYAIAPATYPAPAHHADVKKGKIKEGDPLKWNANAGWCEAWLEERKAQGVEVVKHDKFGMAVDAKNRLLEDEIISEYLKVSKRQVLVTAEYPDAETGLTIPIRCLLDLVPQADHPQFGKTLGDLKTSTSASLGQWTRFVFQRNYHVQAAIFLDAYVAATGEDRCDFRHIIVENYAPWEPGKRIVSQEFLELGRLTYTGHLRRYARCLKDNVWPGYDQAGMCLDGWALTDVESWMIGK